MPLTLCLSVFLSAFAVTFAISLHLPVLSPSLSSPTVAPSPCSSESPLHLSPSFSPFTLPLHPSSVSKRPAVCHKTPLLSKTDTRKIFLCDLCLFVHACLRILANTCPFTQEQIFQCSERMCARARLCVSVFCAYRRELANSSLLCQYPRTASCLFISLYNSIYVYACARTRTSEYSSVQ